MAMPRLEGMFDRTGRVGRPAYRSLQRELWSLLFHFPSRPDPTELAQGGGHVVLVVPAFLTGDSATRPLRDLLTRCGYRACGWTLGINWGPTPGILAGLRRRIRELRDIAGEPVSVVGVSLGGLLARDLAYDCAEEIRQVVTLASPFRLPTATTIEPLFHFCALFYSMRPISILRGSPRRCPWPRPRSSPAMTAWWRGRAAPATARPAARSR
jgi:pimeloyl-ACP methyl ester carboxylesterase